jgi:hypothetical protein
MESNSISTRFENWMTRSKLDFYFGGFFLVQFTLFLCLESTSGMLDRQERVRGRDFMHFYLAGRIVARGESNRLYDQGYFLELQRSLVEINEKCPPYFSVYPPSVALLFSPLGGLPYGRAIVIWWLIQAVCFLVAGSLLFRELSPLPGWRHTAWLGMIAFYPVINTFWNGQLAALLLLVLVTGVELRRRDYSTMGGVVLSLSAMKPQFAAGIALWLLLRRDLRTGAGFCLGLLVQALGVLTVLPPQVFAAFADNTRLYAQFLRVHQNTPDHQHALAGILVDLFGGDFSRWAMLAQLLVTAYAGSLLYRIVRSRRQGSGLVEASAGVLFTLLATPHLLTYDLSYLLIPITYLLSLRKAVKNPGIMTSVQLLYVCTTLTPLYLFLGFSIVPVVLLWALHSLIHVEPGG